MIWGNATEYNCEDQCPRDQVHALVNELVSQKPDGTWIIEHNFHAKFMNANLKVSH